MAKFAKKKPKAKLTLSKDTSKSKYEQLIEHIHKVHGVESIQIGTGTYIDVDTFPSGLPTLDLAMGIAGVPRGRIVEIFGGESSGKTTVTLRMIASCQNSIIDGDAGVAAFIDAEHALDPEWAKKNGVNMDKILFSQPDNGEQAFGIIETLVSAGIPLIIVDSVAALIPKKELDGDIGDSHVGAQARMMSQALRKLNGKCKKMKSTIVFINQLREKVGVMFGSPETTPGGRALKYYASVRIDMRSSSLLKQGEETVIGRLTTAKIIKNKLAPPWKKAEVNIYFGEPKQTPETIVGADEVCSLFKACIIAKIITKKGNFNKFGTKSIGNGDVQAMKIIRADTELFDALKMALYENIKPKVVVTAKDTDEDPSGFDESDDVDNEDVDDEEEAEEAEDEESSDDEEEVASEASVAE